MQNQQYERQYRGWVLRFGLDRGVPLEPRHPYPGPYPSLRVILAEKGAHCKGLAHFSQILQFSGFKPEIWAQSENWTHV